MRGGYAMDKIKVLWMNNGEECQDSFVICTSTYNMEIETCSSIADCKDMLSSSKGKYNVLLLSIDYEVKEGRQRGERKTSSFDIDFIKKTIEDLPYYLVTDSKELSEATETFIRFLKEKVYNLQTQTKMLCEKITSDYNQQIPIKYKKICQFCNYDGLTNLLKEYEQSDKQSIERNNSIPNKVRKVLDWLKMDSTLFAGRTIPDNIHLKLKSEKDYKAGKTIDEQPLNIFSKILGHSDYVPIYVKRSIFACVSTNQPGSHYSPIDVEILNGNAPYVTRSLILELLNILHWCASLDEKTFEL